MNHMTNVWKGNTEVDILSELMKGHFNENYTMIKYISLIALSIIVILLCKLFFYLSKKIGKYILPKYIKKSKSKLITILFEHGFHDKLAHIVPVIILYLVAPLFNEYGEFIIKAAAIYFIIALVNILTSLLDSINELYKQFEISKTRPITPILQIVKVVLFIIAGILLIATFIGEKKPFTLLGGIGALSAVFSLVFKDPILGFVAGVQLTSTDMLRVGDIITVPKYKAEGTVTEIGLTTISLQGFDKMTITLPSYSLITDSFTNYRGMQDSGGRRFRRTFYLDINTIKPCSKEDIDEFSKIDYLNEYIINRREKLLNSLPANISEEDIVKEMGLTNIEILRVCAQNYLENHPEIRKDMMLLVRQLSPEDKGIPIEIYAFTDTTAWVMYERIQEEILDHVYHLASKLGLGLYQNPSARDIRLLASSKE